MIKGQGITIVALRNDRDIEVDILTSNVFIAIICYDCKRNTATAIKKNTNDNKLTRTDYRYGEYTINQAEVECLVSMPHIVTYTLIHDVRKDPVHTITEVEHTEACEPSSNNTYYIDPSTMTYTNTHITNIHQVASSSKDHVWHHQDTLQIHKRKIDMTETNDRTRGTDADPTIKKRKLGAKTQDKDNKEECTECNKIHNKQSCLVKTNRSNKRKLDQCVKCKENKKQMTVKRTEIVNERYSNVTNDQQRIPVHKSRNDTVINRFSDPIRDQISDFILNLEAPPRGQPNNCNIVTNAS